MNNKELVEAFLEFKDEKNIDKATILAILKEVISHALRKRNGIIKKKRDGSPPDEDNFDVIINPDRGDLDIWIYRTVVPDDKFPINDKQEIHLSDAKKIDPDIEVGEEIDEPFELINLGRRAIIALKQNLENRLMEYDYINLHKFFKEREGELYTAEVHHVRPKAVYLIDDEGNELVLPRDRQIPSDRFRKGDNVKGVIEKVDMKGNKPVVILSRTDNRFLEKLFEQEIPEVFDGLITVKKIARIPGEKAKVAVDTYDDRIDPVGACVGVRGSRIHGIVRELGNENIDVINYTDNDKLFIQRALGPVKIQRLEIGENEEGKPTAYVYMKPDEISKAIGKRGQNIRLATDITGYEIEIQREKDEEDIMLTEFDNEIDDWVIQEFIKIGLDTAKSILANDVDDLVRRTDLEEETVIEVINILKEEFKDE
jgi:N utilization substance protein A